MIVDAGRRDGGGKLARAAGANAVSERLRRGHGNAYNSGFQAARGEYIVMVVAQISPMTSTSIRIPF